MGGLRRFGPLGAAGGEQPPDLGDVHIGQIPHVGHEFTIDDEAEIEPVEIAGDSDVEALPVGDNR